MVSAVKISFLWIYFLFFLIPNTFSQTQKDEYQLQKAIKFEQQGKLKDAEQILLKLAKNKSDYSSEFQIKVHNNLGNVYADLGKNKEAIIHYNQALILAKKAGNLLSEGQIKKNIGTIYMSLGQFNTSEEYYHSAKEIAVSLKNKELYADCMNNLGTIFEQTGRNNLAKNCYLEALNHYNKVNQPAHVAMASSNLAIVYKVEQNFDSCIYYNELALHFSRDAGDRWMEAAINNNLGNVYGQINQLEKALFYIHDGLSIAKDIDALEIEISCYESLSDAYHLAKNDQEAYVFLKLQHEKQKEYNNLSISKEIEDLRIKYQTKEKELVNQQLKKDQFNMRVYFVLSLALLIVLMLAFWYIRRKKLNDLHSRQINAAIVESEIETRFRVASDLHDNIGQKIAVLSLFTQQFRDTEPRLQTMIQELSEQVRGVSHSLVPEAFRLGFVNAIFELKKEIEQSTTIQVHIQSEKEVFVDYSPNENLLIYRIVQEIIANVLKHSKSTTLNIDIQANDSSYSLKIRDNGSGFDPVKVKESTGIGWKIIESRVLALSGNVSLHSDSTGTTVEFRFPKKSV